MGNGGDAQGGGGGEGDGVGGGKRPGDGVDKVFHERQSGQPSSDRVRTRAPEVAIAGLVTGQHAQLRRSPRILSPRTRAPCTQVCFLAAVCCPPQLLHPAGPFQPFAIHLRTTGAGVDSHPRRATITHHCLLLPSTRRPWDSPSPKRRRGPHGVLPAARSRAVVIAATSDDHLNLDREPVTHAL